MLEGTPLCILTPSIEEQESAVEWFAYYTDPQQYANTLATLAVLWDRESITHSNIEERAVACAFDIGHALDLTLQALNNEPETWN